MHELSTSAFDESKHIIKTASYLTSWMVSSWSSSQCWHFLPVADWIDATLVLAFLRNIGATATTTIMANMAKGPSRIRLGFWCHLKEHLVWKYQLILLQSKRSVSNHARAVFKALGCFRWLPKNLKRLEILASFYDISLLILCFQSLSTTQSSANYRLSGPIFNFHAFSTNRDSKITVFPDHSTWQAVDRNCIVVS